MAGRGAPKGNKNAAHDKPWTAALQRHAKQNPDKLRNLAIKVFDMALSGDIAAMREIGDRMEGKPTQAITGKDGADLFPYKKIMVALVDP